MNTLHDNQLLDKPATDPIDRLIFEGGLRIKSLWIDRDLDLVIVLLNNKKIIKRSLSDFQTLKQATDKQLLNKEVDGISVHWPDLDEDVSLRGFIKYELQNIDTPHAISSF